MRSSPTPQESLGVRRVGNCFKGDFEVGPLEIGNPLVPGVRAVRRRPLEAGYLDSARKTMGMVFKGQFARR